MNYRANPKGFKRIASGLYVRQEKLGLDLWLFRCGSRWNYIRLSTAFPAPSVQEMKRRVQAYRPGYPTRAMALSAAEGNRAS